LTDDLHEVRSEVAAGRGLDARAAGLLTGTTLEEIETSADALVKLIDARRVRQDQEPPDMLTAARTEQARRKQELTARLTRRSPQPRDELGRYASRARTFDGGARRPVPAPGDPRPPTPGWSVV
jgi:hypothetical protein